MTNTKTTDALYRATNEGREIILDLIPDLRKNEKAFFKIRDEKDASVHMFKSNESGIYCVKDFGSGQCYDPINLYMTVNHIRFRDALNELCNKYGVEVETFKYKSSMPKTEYRCAEEGEKDSVKLSKNGCDNNILNFLKNHICMDMTATALDDLGWCVVESYTHVYIDRNTGELKASTTSSTEDYPILAQKCYYDDDKQFFYRIYQPLYKTKPGKASYKFSFINKPDNISNYIFCLPYLKKCFYKNKRKKIDKVIICSGGSDAMVLRAMGYVPVYFNSESANFTQQMYDTLLLYAKEVYLLYDIDETGETHVKEISTHFPRIKVVRLPQPQNKADYKDLREYVHKCFVNKQKLQELFDKAVESPYSHFWTEKDGKYYVSPFDLLGFLEQQGFYRLKGAGYIRKEGVIVDEIQEEDISGYLRNWAENNNLPLPLINTILEYNAKKLLNHCAHNLRPVELNFDSKDMERYSIFFFFQDVYVELGKDGPILHYYSDTIPQHYVYRTDISSFSLGKFKYEKTIHFSEEDGQYTVDISKDKSCLMKLLYLTSIKNWEKLDKNEDFTLEENKAINQNIANKVFALGYPYLPIKSEANAKAFVFQDGKVLSDPDINNGGSGKSTVSGYMTKIGLGKLVPLDNKAFNNERFPFSNVSASTTIVRFDETDKNFNYEGLKEYVTNGFHIEKKHKAATFLPYEKTPAMYISSNYVINKKDASIARRFVNVVFYDYFHYAVDDLYESSRSILDVFEFELFNSDRYKEYEWLLDINAAFQIIQFVMNLPYNVCIEAPSQDIDKRRMVQDLKIICMNFFEEHIGTMFAFNTPYKLDDIFNAFKIYSGGMTNIGNFTKKLKEYCTLKDYTYNPKEVTGKNKDGEKWVEDNITLVYFSKKINEGVA